MKTKTIITVIILMITTNVFSQFGINIGNDLKISTVGTDNEFTKHSGRFNYQIKAEYIDYRNTYFAVGIKYVNLDEYYLGLFASFGEVIELNDKWTLIPQLEVGRIQRERKHMPRDFKVLYGQINTNLRYKVLPWLSAEAQGYLQWARDLPNRTFRYGGNIAVIIHIK